MPALNPMHITAHQRIHILFREIVVIRGLLLHLLPTFASPCRRFLLFLHCVLVGIQVVFIGLSIQTATIALVCVDGWSSVCTVYSSSPLVAATFGSVHCAKKEFNVCVWHSYYCLMPKSNFSLTTNSYCKLQYDGFTSSLLLMCLRKENNKEIWKIWRRKNCEWKWLALCASYSIRVHLLASETKKKRERERSVSVRIGTLALIGPHSRVFLRFTKMN